MTKIFVDSNFFIALSNPRDSLYETAVKKSKEIKRQKQVIVISRYIFLEVVTVLSQRTNRDNAVRVGNQLLSGQIEMIETSTEIFEDSWEFFKRIRKKNVGFVDCSHLVVMQAEGIKKFLTFDREDFSSLRKTYDFSFY